MIDLNPQRRRLLGATVSSLGLLLAARADAAVLLKRRASGSERAKTIRFSGSQFGAVVEVLEDTSRNDLLGPKPFQQEFPVIAQHPLKNPRRCWGQSPRQ